MMKKVLIFVAVLFLFQQESLYAASWNTSGKITRIYLYSINGIYVMHENMINTDSCQNASNYVLKFDNPMYKEIYSLLLSAKLTQSNVKIYIDECTGTGTSGYPKIVHAILE